MNNVLVTGSAGFIGSHFIDALLLNPNVNVVGIDSLGIGSNDSYEQHLNNDNFDFYKADINNITRLNRIFEHHHIDTVINCAAETHVDRSILNAEQFVLTNILGTQNLIDVSRKHWETSGFENKRFHQVSTDEVYGSLEIDEIPFTENTPLDPSSPYAASKASADMLCMAAFRTHNFPVSISRCSNNFGPRQHPEKLIPKYVTFLDSFQELNIKFPLYGNGLNIRDWIYVEDHIIAIFAILNDKNSIGKIYNISGENQLSNLQIMQMIYEIYSKEYGSFVKNPFSETYEFVSDRLGHDLRYAINSSKFKEKYGDLISNSRFFERLQETVLSSQ